VTHPDIGKAVRRALEEDIGPGDITSNLTVDAARVAQGRFLAREPLILAGVAVLPLLYEMRGGVEELSIHFDDGARLEPGQEIAFVRGKARTLLECERTALNFLQRLSGVATLARKYADAVSGTGCRILDTRKTTPGLRILEKMAVAAGGASNHRIGLFDAILIKNNHVTAAGGVRAALQRVSNAHVPVEIEVRTREELDEALAAGATRLLLDNLTPAEAAEWVRHIAGRASTEISGGITIETVRAYAESGADFISVGALTHSAPAVDINFRMAI
jgi:nicotinate-nucleotide pyrophosphorylase (carboxylating)